MITNDAPSLPLTTPKSIIKLEFPIITELLTIIHIKMCVTPQIFPKLQNSLSPTN